VLATAVAILALTPSGSHSNRVTGEVVGTAKLESGRGSQAEGRARLDVYPRHGEVDLNVRRFPRPQGEIFIVWLAPAHSKRAHIGGAFPRDALGRNDLSTVVPGSPTVSRAHTKRAERVVITHLPRQRARETARKARDTGWRNATRIRGTRVVHGRVTEPG
jgi:hypothetical protein